MIERQDFRNSVSNKKYNHPVKQDAKEIEEWKFTFANFNRCKQWYFYLEKLKVYFEKNHQEFDKFTELMANFDTDLRNSLPRHSKGTKSAVHSNNQTQKTSPVTQSSPNPKTSAGKQDPKTIFLPPYVDKPIASEIITQKYQNDPNFFPIIQETTE